MLILKRIERENPVGTTIVREQVGDQLNYIRASIAYPTANRQVEKKKEMELDQS